MITLSVKLHPLIFPLLITPNNFLKIFCTWIAGMPLPFSIGHEWRDWDDDVRACEPKLQDRFSGTRASNCLQLTPSRRLGMHRLLKVSSYHRILVDLWGMGHTTEYLKWLSSLSILAFLFFIVEMNTLIWLKKERKSLCFVSAFQMTAFYNVSYDVLHIWFTE